VKNGEPVEQILSVGRKFYQNFSPVLIARAPFHRAVIDEPVDEFNRTVMAQAEPLRKRRDGGPRTLRQPF
jgi:hypothetical protein